MIYVKPLTTEETITLNEMHKNHPLHMSRKRAHSILMCQHFSGHKFTQLFAEFRILLVTNSHWQNGFSLGYKTPQYIQI